MSIEHLRGAFPEYAKDIKLNLSTIARDETLGAERLWGCLFASALATRNPLLIREIGTDAKAQMSAGALSAAKAAAALMAMNNVYYRATHLMTRKDYTALPAKLRMNAIASPGTDKADFELFCLAVSAVNGCGMCLDAHEATLRAEGVSQAEIQTALRAAAIINAAATVLEAEEALALREEALSPA
ncbi:MAG: carboxymuconolactone decarboxylase family protein [Pseudomonadota bacterium]